jgi:plastocyanin
MKVALTVAVILLLAAVVPIAMAQDANRVEVGMVEHQFNMPDSIPAGLTVFEVTNNGGAPHNFHIEGQGIDRVFETNLQPGETQTMEVDLTPGSYTIYCPVGNHRQLGMELQLNVTEAGMAEPAPEAEATPEPMAEAPQEPVQEAPATPVVATLPQTGGTLTPLTPIILLVVGAGLILAGGLAMALSRR